MTDVSTDGPDPDPNNDGRPDEMTPTPIILDDIDPPPVLMPPIAVDDQATTPQNTPITFSVTDNDSDADGVIVPSTVDLDPSVADRQSERDNPGEGRFVVDDLGDVTFTPAADFTGVSTISYTVQDDDGLLSNIATITVTVTMTGGDLVADAGPDQTVFVEQTVTLDGRESMPLDVMFAWEIVEQPVGSNAVLSDVNDIMPTFVADQPGTYRVELVVSNDELGISTPDEVSITAVVPAVIAHGVGLADSGEGRITLALPGAPIQAFLTWKRKDGATDNQILFSNGVEEVTLSGIVSADPDADRIRCYYADITRYILTSPDVVTYTVTHPEAIPGAGMVVVASNLVADIDQVDVSDVEGRLQTISRIRLGEDTDPRRRVIDIQAGCDFFFHNRTEPLEFNFAASVMDREAKVTLFVADAQSNNAPRRGDVMFASPADAPPMQLGSREPGLIASDGCFWDTFGRNSGAEPPVPGCADLPFAPSGDPDRRGDVRIPANATTALVRIQSPVPASAQEPRGVSATLSLAVFELIAPLNGSE